MVGREFALAGALIAWAAFAAPVAAAPAAPAQKEKASRLSLCNPAGGIRADRTPRGLRIRYLDKTDRPGGVDFTLPGWEVRASGKGGCVEFVKALGGGAPNSAKKDVLSAKDEVIVYGGAFQDKVILRRGQRVIDLGGEKIVIEETEVLTPAGKR